MPIIDGSIRAISKRGLAEGVEVADEVAQGLAALGHRVALADEGPETAAARGHHERLQ